MQFKIIKFVAVIRSCKFYNFSLYTQAECLAYEPKHVALHLLLNLYLSLTEDICSLLLL